MKEKKKVKIAREKKPFVWVHSVTDGSPGELDGLRMGDAIYEFGDITHTVGD